MGVGREKPGKLTGRNRGVNRGIGRKKPGESTVGVGGEKPEK